MNKEKILLATQDNIIDSLFIEGGTLANEKHVIEIKKHRKNANTIFFSIQGKNYCINKYDVILKYLERAEGKFYQVAVLDFTEPEYKRLQDILITYKNGV